MINKIIKSVKTTILTLLVTAVLATTTTDVMSFYSTDWNISVCSEEYPDPNESGTLD